jgi:hypothetical protein
MNAEDRHNVTLTEKLPPVTITGEAEREYFENLSKRLLSTVGKLIVIPAAAVGVLEASDTHEWAQRVGVVFPSFYNPAVGVAIGLSLGLAFSAREIWNVRNERFPRS